MEGLLDPLKRLQGVAVFSANPTAKVAAGLDLHAVVECAHFLQRCYAKNQLHVPQSRVYSRFSIQQLAV